MLIFLLSCGNLTVNNKAVDIAYEIRVEKSASLVGHLSDRNVLGESVLFTILERWPAEEADKILKQATYDDIVYAIISLGASKKYLSKSVKLEASKDFLKRLFKYIDFDEQRFLEDERIQSRGNISLLVRTYAGIGIDVKLFIKILSLAIERGIYASNKNNIENLFKIYNNYPQVSIDKIKENEKVNDRMVELLEKLSDKNLLKYFAYCLDNYDELCKKHDKLLLFCSRMLGNLEKALKNYSPSDFLNSIYEFDFESNYFDFILNLDNHSREKK